MCTVSPERIVAGLDFDASKLHSCDAIRRRVWTILAIASAYEVYDFLERTLDGQTLLLIRPLQITGNGQGVEEIYDAVDHVIH